MVTLERAPKADGSASPVDASSPEAEQPLVESAQLGFMDVHYRREPGLALPRLVLVASKREKISMEGVEGVLGMLRTVFDRREYLTITWDAREFSSLPSRSHVSRGIEWAKDPVVKELLDDHLMGIAVIVRNMFLRGILSLIIRVLSPQQPMKACQDEKEAYEFLREKCQVVKAYVEKKEKKGGKAKGKPGKGAAGGAEGDPARAADASADGAAAAGAANPSQPLDVSDP